MKRIGFTSDIHLDVNTGYLNAQDLYHAAKDLLLDSLIIAGDISNGSSYIPNLINTFKEIDLKFVLGNHDYYIENKKEINSFDIRASFKDLPNYLPLFPLITEDYIIIGDTGWYDYSFGPTGYTKSFYDKMKFSSWTWPDKRFCNWIGMTNEEVSEHFLQILENQLKQIEDKKIIVITHVVPHEDFIMKKEGPYNREWNYNNAFFGTKKLHELYKKYNVEKAIFGHTHSKYEKKIDGIEYICSPVGYYMEIIENYDFEEMKHITDYLKKRIKILELN